VSTPTVRTTTTEEHRRFLAGRSSASFLQTPAWGRVKSEWRRESLGWFDGEEQVGAALVLYRRLPKVQRSLAYLPEGPVISWADDGADLAAWLDPMTRHLATQGAFGVRMGPPVVLRRWSAAQVKAGVADPAVRRLGDLAPLERDPVGARVVSQLTSLGWRRQVAEGGFAAGQPAYVFQVPLAGPDGPRTEDEVLAGMNQLWRRNIKKAAKLGVEVTALDGVAALDELEAFHDLYVHTAERDHFTPRPLSYFQTMVEALAEEGTAVGAADRITLWTARHGGDLVAATISIRVGEHAWYSYGASSTEKRDVRGSNAVQWEMLRAALAAGATTYDLRGITDTLDADDSHVGLIQFKVGTGGEAVELAGEWDLPLPGPVNRGLYKAFELYMQRRAKGSS
jgi:vancomycin resistance protein VanK